MREPFTTIRKGKYKIVQGRNNYGQDVYILKRRFWGFIYIAIEHSGTPVDLSFHMDSCIKHDI